MQLPGFHIQSTLLQGDTFDVLRATRRPGGEPVLLKVLRHGGDGPLSAARLRHELELSRSLDLACIPKWESFESSGMEHFLIASDPGFESPREPGSLEQFLEHARDICRAVDQLHREQLLHLGLGPRHYLYLPRDRQIVFVDLGHSRFARNNIIGQNASGLWENLLPYIAPELTGRTNNPVDFRTDLYALGVLFFEWLTGKLPFEATHPLEWIHAHLATEPPSARRYKPEVPAMLDKITAKLMAKMADDRYPGVDSLVHDLVKCRDLLRHGDIPDFEPAVDFRKQYFSIPSKLYGRESERRALESFLKRILAGDASGGVFISGYSGIGKTSLVAEAGKKLLRERGYFISGKFDQLNRSIPYQGIIQAFTGLAQQMLADNDRLIGEWRQRILDALGANAQLINDAIPSFEILLGRQKDPVALPSEEASNRYLHTWDTFIRTLATPGNPIVLFLDDMQWADLASLQLLERLLGDRNLHNIAVVGAYRDNEVGTVHPLHAMLVRLRALHRIEEIYLGALPGNSVSELLQDTLNQPAENLRGLTDWMLEKTDGNPFYITQSLSHWYSEGLFLFDRNSGRWAYDLPALQQAGVSDNVVDLLVGSIQKLDPRVQEALQISACIGSEFTLEDLRCIADEEHRKALLTAIEKGLVRPLDDRYLLLSAPDAVLDAEAPGINIPEARFRFLHDRVQQAAHSMLSDDARIQIHHRLGTALWERANEEEREEQIFEIANHLNQGIPLIITRDESIRLARINQQAGQRARMATAYQQALEFLQTGIKLLPEQAYEGHYDLFYQLHLELGRTHFLQGNTAEAEKRLTELLQKSKSRLDKLQVLQILVDMNSNLNEHVKVVDTLEKALRLFNIRMPRKPTAVKMAVLAGIIDMKRRTARMAPQQILSLPQSQDPDLHAFIGLVTTTGASTYVYSQDLFAWIVLLQTRYSMKYGNTPNSAIGYAGYGMILSTAFNDFDSAFTYLELAEALNNEYDNLSFRHKLGFLRWHFLGHFRYSASEILENIPRLYYQSLEAGDHMYAGFCLDDLTWYGAVIGRNLDDLCRDGDEYMDSLIRINNLNAYDMMLIQMQALRALSGKPLLPWALDQPQLTIAQRLEKDIADKSFTQVALTYMYTYQMAYFLDKQADIERLVREGHRYHEFIIGFYIYADFALYTSLCAYKFRTPDNLRAFTKIVGRHLNLLATRAKSCPANYLHHHRLVSALYWLLKGQDNRAVRTLEECISGAEPAGFRQIVAIASEILAGLYLEKGMPAIADRFLQEAVNGYDHWGATAKVDQLYELYPQLMARESNLPERASSRVAADLDLSSLMKSATAISGEIQLDKLLPAMIHIVSENAGAQSGILLLNTNDQLIISALQSPQYPQGVLASEVTVSEKSILPVSLVQYVKNTGEVLVLNLPASDERFKNDAYLQTRQPRSVMCLPVRHQGVLRGMIYLENNLMLHAFTEQRTDTIRILSAQIAVSLDNAMLYKELEEALEKQVKLTNAYSRFTPTEYLGFLGHSSILDVRLGDHRSESMTVLFADIRAYTSLAEEMTPEENFLFLSSYLRQMAAVVTDNFGMVNQLLGDGLLAFFWKAEDGLAAAIGMQDALRTYNKKREAKGRRPIRVGIGLHTGSVIIGIVGDENKMDTGIVSDTVNAAARIEGLTKYYGVNILISEMVERELPEKYKQDAMRFLGKVQVKGKKNSMGMYECFAGDSPSMQQSKRAGRKEFDLALEHYQQGRFEQAESIFQEIANRIGLADPVLTFFLDRSRLYLKEGKTVDWDGVETVDFK